MYEITVFDKNGEIMDTLIQWDKNIYVYISEEGITSAHNVHFFNSNRTEALVVSSTYDDSTGELRAKIPNVLLTECLPICGYVYVESGDEGRSVYGFNIIVRKRIQPSDYIHVDAKDYISIITVLEECRELSSNASVSATNAKTSEDNAKISETNADSSAKAAATSEVNAKDSENVAIAKADIAVTKSDEAKASADNAKESETNALASAQLSSEKADSASTSATNASNSADSASTSAGIALENANIAIEKASVTTEQSNIATEAAEAATTKANEATQSAISAAESAILASDKAIEADASAKSVADISDLSESYAVGGTGTRDGEDIDNAKYYYNQAKEISQTIAGVLKPKGTVSFENLPELSSASSGDMYNISNQFTTTEDFKEGEGNLVPTGSNVYKTDDGKWDVLAGSLVSGVKGDKETEYRTGNINIKPSDIGALDSSADLTYISNSGIETEDALLNAMRFGNQPPEYYAKQEDLNSLSDLVTGYEHLEGVTATVTEINMLGGITDNVQDQLNNKADSSRLGGLSFIPMSQEEYDALKVKDANTIYIVL